MQDFLEQVERLLLKVHREAKALAKAHSTLGDEKAEAAARAMVRDTQEAVAEIDRSKCARLGKPAPVNISLNLQ